MNQYTMVAVIVVAVMIASVLRARYLATGVRNAGDAPNAETTQLRREVEQLKERLAVLERITVEKENSLARQIDELRNT
jgi:uncharacterized protein YlxW (UPF0749 family)